MATLALFAPILIPAVTLGWALLFPIEPTMGTPAYQNSYAYRAGHKDDYEPRIDAGVKRALVKFPNAQACLESGARADNRADLVRMDWDRIITRGDAEVCIYRLLHGWGGVADAQTWLEAQGFRVSDSFTSAKPYVASDGRLRVSSSWSVRDKGPRFPTKGVLRRILVALPYSMSVGATYSPDGSRLLYVGLGFSTL